MFYLLAAVLFSSLITFGMKYSESHDCNRYAVTVFNYLTGFVVSIFTLRGGTFFIPGEDGAITIGLAFFNGFFYLVSLLMMQFSTRKNGAPLTATFSRLGIVVPILVSMVFFNEIPAAIQALGLLLAVGAIVLMNGGSEKDAEARRGILLLLAVFITNGFADTGAKVFSFFGNSVYQQNYILYTFGFAVVMSFGVFLIKNRSISRRDVLAGFMVGLPNQLSAIFFLKAVHTLPAYLVYPVNGAAVIMVVNIGNFLIYKERLTRRQYICTVLIGAALCLINL